MTRGTHNSKVKIVEDASDATQWGTTTFNETRIAEKSQQFILNANVPLSNQRDIQIVSNNGTIAKDAAEYKISATADTGSNARLRSARRGNYISGNEAEAGLGVRVPTQPTGDAFVRWGYYEITGGNITGLYFEYTADGVDLVIADAGTEKKRIKQPEWNLDDMLSDDNLFDMSDGNVFQIRFVYYGYGPIIWEIGERYLDSKYNMIPVHLEKLIGDTSISEPNLPITIEVDSGNTGVALDAYLGGRQFSVFGKNLPNERIVGAYRGSVGSIGATFVPLVSFREKTNFENILLRLSAISLLCNDDMYYEIRKDGTLTDATFAKPNNYTADEVATEWDVSATAISGGETIKSGLVQGAARLEITSEKLPQKTVIADTIYTLCVAMVSGTNGTAVSHFEILEAW